MLFHSIISRLSVLAGTAGVALKDKQQENNVIAAGGMFYLLIVENFEYG